jgi:hypothetical protein
MSLLKRRNRVLLIIGLTALLILLVYSLFLFGNSKKIMRCQCQGDWLPEEGICANTWTNAASGQAPADPFCHLHGVHSEKQTCIGDWEKQGPISPVGFLDSYECHGLLIKQGQCYGIPYSASSDEGGGPISCNYPCDDQQILEACKTQDVIRFDRVTVSCAQLENWCN